MTARNGRRKGILLLAAVLLLFRPAWAAASGEWLTLSASGSSEELAGPVQEFTGTVRMTFLGDCTLGERRNSATQPGDFTGWLNRTDQTILSGT